MERKPHRWAKAVAGAAGGGGVLYLIVEVIMLFFGANPDLLAIHRSHPKTPPATTATPVAGPSTPATGTTTPQVGPASGQQGNLSGTSPSTGAVPATAQPVTGRGSTPSSAGTPQGTAAPAAPRTEQRPVTPTPQRSAAPQRSEGRCPDRLTAPAQTRATEIDVSVQITCPPPAGQRLYLADRVTNADGRGHTEFYFPHPDWNPRTDTSATQIYRASITRGT